MTWKPPDMADLMRVLGSIEKLAQQLEHEGRNDIADIIRLNTLAAHFNEMKRIKRMGTKR